jgi:hypothetical protein
MTSRASSRKISRISASSSRSPEAEGGSGAGGGTGTGGGTGIRSPTVCASSAPTAWRTVVGGARPAPLRLLTAPATPGRSAANARCASVSSAGVMVGLRAGC